ncbi:glycosyl transferase family 2 [Humitalea rosea]|uniref:Glycosyl transferase family 2 n=1 Tax=Humitalea rosea TaxID=990373 RepID=A0A2W7IHQ6_9PROT|nr:glycosyltransferase family A protein [Humitalea rosea]PZW36956.1 glycosyl transferase family 2 [Humitalea rosea]
MRISVLMPCRNAAPYLPDALGSVLQQQPPPFEVIAVDDGSTDATPTILAGFAPRVTLLRQPHRGVAAALNAAAGRARGEALAFLDADDLWLPGKLAAQQAALLAGPGLDGVFGHMRNFLSPDLPAAESAALARSVPLAPRPGLVKSTLLLRSAALQRLGGFDEARQAADFLAWYAAAQSRGFRWAMLPELVCLRRIHAGNMSRRERPRQHADYLLTMKSFLDARRAGTAPSSARE